MEEEATTTLRPRHEGESIKKAVTVLRRRRERAVGDNKRALKLQLCKRQKVKKEHPIVILTAEKLLKDSRLKMADKKRLNRSKRIPPPKVKMVKAQQQVVFAIRNSRKGGSLETKKLLGRMGLRKPFQGVFLPNNGETMTLLRRVDPFAFYGYPSQDSVRSIFVKRAMFKGTTGDKVLCDNNVVEDTLSHVGLLCVEDVIDEVWKMGSSFDDISKVLCPIEFSHLKRAEGLESRPNEYGNIGVKINEKIAKIL